MPPCPEMASAAIDELEMLMRAGVDITDMEIYIDEIRRHCAGVEAMYE